MAIDKSKEAAIRGLREYHEELHAELKSVLENMDHVAKSIELLGGDPVYKPVDFEESSQGSIAIDSTSVEISDYSGMKTQAGVERFLEENPDGSFKASVVAKELLNRGLPKTSKAYQSSVAGALNRAVKKGLAFREKRNGALRYQYNGESAEERSLL